MANYSWSQAWNTETETVKVAAPIEIATDNMEADGKILSDGKYLGRLMEVVRATKVMKHVADITAAGAVDFDTSDLYMVAENIYAGNDFFVGYPIKDKADLKHLEVRTVFDDLLGQYVATKRMGVRN